ncbi:MAG: peptide deformylase [Patescibacteria group bacterium]
MKKIVQKDSAVLREVAKEVDPREIPYSKIQKILKEMRESLDSQDDGVAIAAPQIGYSLRIFVVSRKVAMMNKKVTPETESLYKDSVYINPIIKKISKEKKVLEEGCLSVRYLYGKVKRSEKATVEALDENGKKFSRGGTGLLAQIFQHEIDHLDGILFIDKAKDLEEILPKKDGTTK